MKKLWGVHGALFLANLIYAANFTIAKEVMPEYIQPFGFIVLRVSVATFLFWLIHTFFIKEKIKREDIPLLAICGLFGVALNQMLFFKGLSITYPINGALVMTTTPILVLIISNILIKEKITILKSCGVALGLIGAVMIISRRGDIQLASDTMVGDICIFINALSYGIFMVIVKPLMKKYHPLTVVFWIFFFGFFMVLPFGWNELQSIVWSSFSAAIWWGVIFVVIGTTFLAYLLNTVALKYVNPSVVSIYIYVQPAFASSIAVLFGKDTITVYKLAASLLIFVGVYFVSMPSFKKLKK